MIELKIQASSPDMLRDTLLAFGNVMRSGLIAPNDQVTMTATDTTAPAGTPTIEAWVDQAPDTDGTTMAPEVAAAVQAARDADTEPAPRKRGRPRKISAEPSDQAKLDRMPDIEPEPEVLTEEDEQEAEGAVEPPPPPSAPIALRPPRPRPSGRAEPIVYTRDDLRAAINRVMNTHGGPEARARLKMLGYEKSSDVPDHEFEHAINVMLGA